MITRALAQQLLDNPTLVKHNPDRALTIIRALLDENNAWEQSHARKATAGANILVQNQNSVERLRTALELIIKHTECPESCLKIAQHALDENTASLTPSLSLSLPVQIISKFIDHGEIPTLYRMIQGAKVIWAKSHLLDWNPDGYWYDGQFVGSIEEAFYLAGNGNE